MEIIQLPPMEFHYQVCILWKNPRYSNCRIWFINNDLLMSCQPDDHDYVKKEIQFEDEEEEDYGNEEFDINDKKKKKKLLDDDNECDHSEDEEFQNENLEDEGLS